MSLVQPTTLAEYLDEEVSVEMAAAIERAEAIAASKIGCRELRSRTVKEHIPVQNEYRTTLTGIGRQELMSFPTLHLSDGPARSITTLDLIVGDVTLNILPGARITDTGFAVKYKFPFGFGFKVDLPYDEAEVEIEYVAGWRTEADLPAGIRQFVIAQATQTYATPIGGIIKVRLGDNYVDLKPEAIAKQTEQYAEMLDQWRRVRL